MVAAPLPTEHPGGANVLHGRKAQDGGTRWPAVATTSASALRAPAFSLVLETPAAAPGVAHAHFAAKLAFETDPSDVHADLEKGVPGLVVVDTRSAASYAKGHVPGARSVPYRSITAEAVGDIPKDTLVVVYCTGPACNASTKGAVRFAALGYRVKEMIGGLEGWRFEGFPVATGPA